MKNLFTAVLLASSLFAASAQAAVSTNQRVLVVVSELDTHGIRELQPLYSAIEHLTRVSTQAILGNSYREIQFLNGSDATFARYKSTLRTLAQRDDIKAIDVIFSLHGSPGSVHFEDGSWKVDTMKTRFLMAVTPAEQAIVNKTKRKLRMIYNLSCFGSSHRSAFLAMGFDVVNGSIGVNANSEVEYVPALTLWSTGMGFKDSFNATNNDLALAAADGPLVFAGNMANNFLKKVNSKKLFSGNTALKISTDPI